MSAVRDNAEGLTKREWGVEGPREGRNKNKENDEDTTAITGRIGLCSTSVAL